MRLLILTLLTISQTFAQAVVFPLHVDDRWVYHYAPLTGGGQFTLRVVADSIMQNARTYAVIHTDSTSEVQYQRQQGDSVYSYNPYRNAEDLFYDFSRHVGDTISTTVNGPDTMDIVLLSKYVMNVFGAFRRAWLFYVNPSRHSVDVDYTASICDSLGLFTRTPSFGDSYSLTGAVISGRVYGTVVYLSPKTSNHPGAVHLWQNYPNPFNPTTTIQFSLVQASQVTFQVFNQLAQVMARVTISNGTPGVHSIQLNGSSWPSGVYYYQLITPNTNQARKMILQK